MTSSAKLLVGEQRFVAGAWDTTKFPFEAADAVNGTWEASGGLDRAWGLRPEVVTVAGRVTFVSHLLSVSPLEMSS